jgi:hypothetical protein
VVLVEGGRVAATGTHTELLATSAAYRSVLAAGAQRTAAGAAPEDLEVAADEAGEVVLP